MTSSFTVSTRDAKPLSVEQRAINVNPAATRQFFLTSRLKNAGQLENPYRQHGMTYAASRVLATNIAQVPFLIHSGESEESEDIVRDGPWVELYDRPNPIMSRSQFWESIILQLLEPWGMSVIVKEGAGDEMIGPQEIPVEMWPISGRYFTPVIDEDTKLPRAWLYRTPNMAKAIVYEPHELCFLRQTDPCDPLRGLGPYAPAELAILQDYKAAKYNEFFFDNDATPGGLLLAEGNITADQAHQIREAWNEMHQGSAKRRRVALLKGGLKYEETGSTHREMEFEKGRAFAWKEELAILGVPEYEVGLTQNINMATAQMISKDFVTKREVPLMRLIEDGMWSELFMPVEGGNARKASFSDLRTSRRFAQARRAGFPNAQKKLGRDVRSYFEFRRLDQKRGGGYDMSPVRVYGSTSIWGEFDLTAIEALREDFGAKLEQAVKAQSMGVPFNQINERLDLGFDPLEGDAGETSFISGSLKTIDEAINPPEPVVAPLGGPGAKPGVPAPGEKPEPKAGEGTAKPAKEDKEEKKTVARAKLVAFVNRRPASFEKRWLDFIKKTKPLEEKFRSKYKRWLNELRAEMLKKLGETKPFRAESELTKGAIEHILFDENSAKRRLMSLSHGVYVEASKLGIDSAMTDLGGNFAFDVVDPKVVEAMDERRLKLANSTTTLRNRVKRDLERGVEAGETIHELQQRLRTDFNAFSGARSLMIARTEVAGATNAARNLAFEEEGVDQTQWITARDEAVRDSHAEIDGDKANVGQPFDNGLLYPGDPAGAAEEVINCRCVAIPVVGRNWKPSSVRAREIAEQRAHELKVAEAAAPRIVLPATTVMNKVELPPVPVVVNPTPITVENKNVIENKTTPQPIVVNPTPVTVINQNHVDARPEESDKDVDYKHDDDGNVTGYTVKKAKEKK